MRPSENEDRNFVKAALAYTSMALLSSMRRHIDLCVLRATDMKITHKLVQAAKGQAAANLLMQEIIEPQVSRDPDLGSGLGTLSLLDEKGMFTRIMLQEFSALPRRIRTDMPDPEVRDETRRFVRHFLDSVARKERGEEIELLFVEKSIRVGILLVAQTETYRRMGLNAYQWRIMDDFRRGADVVYLCALGENVELVKTLLSLHKRNPSLRIENSGVYKARMPDGTTARAICAGLRSMVSDFTPDEATLIR
jgi:hypothetical protein